VARPVYRQCGVIVFTHAAEFALRFGARTAQPIHNAGELQQVRYAEESTTLTHDELGFGRHQVSPLRWN
jgi:hypothetical protein